MRFRVFESTSGVASVLPQGVLKNNLPYVLVHCREAVEYFSQPQVAEVPPVGFTITDRKPVMWLTKSMLTFLGLEPGDKIQTPKICSLGVEVPLHISVKMPAHLVDPSYRTFDAQGDSVSILKLCMNQISIPKFLHRNQSFWFTQQIVSELLQFEVQVTISSVDSEPNNLRSTICHIKPNDENLCWEFIP